MILGDMNAHVRKSKAFDFTENLQQENLNGRMLSQLVSNCQLQCINPLKWSTGVKDFVVDMRDEYCLYTDHASMVVTLDVSDIPLEYADLVTRSYRRHNWTAFSKKVEEVVEYHNRRFCGQWNQYTAAPCCALSNQDQKLFGNNSTFCEM